MYEGVTRKQFKAIFNFDLIKILMPLGGQQYEINATDAGCCNGKAIQFDEVFHVGNV